MMLLNETEENEIDDELTRTKFVFGATEAEKEPEKVQLVNVAMVAFVI